MPFKFINKYSFYFLGFNSNDFNTLLKLKLNLKIVYKKTFLIKLILHIIGHEI